MITQAMGFRLATPTEWRYVLFFSFILSVAQVLVSAFVTESPVYLASKGQLDAKNQVARKLWGSPVPECKSTFGRANFNLTCIKAPSHDAEDPLLNELEAYNREDDHVVAISVPQLFAARELRRPLTIVCLAMAAQQLSGAALQLPPTHFCCD